MQPGTKIYIAHMTHPKTGHTPDKHNLVVVSRWPIRNVAQYRNDLVLAPPFIAQ